MFTQTTTDFLEIPQEEALVETLTEEQPHQIQEEVLAPLIKEVIHLKEVRRLTKGPTQQIEVALPTTAPIRPTEAVALAIDHSVEVLLQEALLEVVEDHQEDHQEDQENVDNH